MAVFKDYAKYYDLIYREKDYKAESEYVGSLLKKYSEIPVNCLLNIGCGTGKHDRHLYEAGFSVDAFDMSEDMISYARLNNPSGINFFKNNIKEFKSSKKYDAIVSLFHVMSYQTKNEDVNSLFSLVKKNLKPGGMFIFDFWYGPAVLTDKPEIRTKQIASEEFSISRRACPELLHNENTVIVNYDLNIKDLNGNFIEDISESHYMRYFFIPELEMFAEANSCKIKCFFEWMTTNEPFVNSWNVCLVGTLNN